MTRKKLFTSFSLLGFALAAALVYAAGDAPVAPAPANPNAKSEAEIAKTASAFVEAFHKEDSAALAKFWTEDGDFTDLSGRTISGRKAIAEDFAHLFAENNGLKLRIEIHTIRFPTPDTAIEDGVTSVLADDGLPNRARYTNFLVKKDGAWLISSVRESAYTPPNNYEQLRPLEWAIGEWAEDTKVPHVARVSFSWSPDKNYIIGLRAVAVKDVILDDGSQRIGWDPAAKIIRSWNFESDGGFSEGSWKNSGNTWTIKNSAVLRSGSLMTSTTTLTRVDNDNITVQVKDQTLDGKPLPDTGIIKMKRVK